MVSRKELEEVISTGNYQKIGSHDIKFVKEIKGVSVQVKINEDFGLSTAFVS